jgi:hypothetical protein
VKEHGPLDAFGHIAVAAILEGLIGPLVDGITRPYHLPLYLIAHVEMEHQLERYAAKGIFPNADLRYNFIPRALRNTLTS